MGGGGAGHGSLLANLQDTIDMIHGIGASTLLPPPPGAGVPLGRQTGALPTGPRAALPVGVPVAAPAAPASVVGSVGGDSIMNNPAHPVQLMNPAVARFGGRVPVKPARPWGLIIAGIVLGLFIVGAIVAILVIKRRNKQEAEKTAKHRAEIEEQRTAAAAAAFEQHRQLQEAQAAHAAQQAVQQAAQRAAQAAQGARLQAPAPQGPTSAAAPAVLPVVVSVTDARPGVGQAVSDFDREFRQRNASRFEIVEEVSGTPAAPAAPVAPAAPAARPHTIVNPDPGLLHVAAEVAKVIAVQDAYGGHTKEVQRDDAALLTAATGTAPAPPLHTPATTDTRIHQALLDSAAPTDGSHPAGQRPVAPST
jgi:hypothetical protein